MISNLKSNPNKSILNNVKAELMRKKQDLLRNLNGFKIMSSEDSWQLEFRILGIDWVRFLDYGGIFLYKAIDPRLAILNWWYNQVHGFF